MQDKRLTVILPTRYTPQMRMELTAYANTARMTEGEVIRLAVAKFLNGKRTTSRGQNAAKDTRNERAPQPATA